jgi:hypothetical protein
VSDQPLTAVRNFPDRIRSPYWRNAAIALACKHTMWLVDSMKSVGIFEAKTKLTSLCEEVVRSGVAILIQKRGTPMVVLQRAEVPSHSGHPDILAAWHSWQENHLPSEVEFPQVEELRTPPKPNPLAQ